MEEVEVILGGFNFGGTHLKMGTGKACAAQRSVISVDK